MFGHVANALILIPAVGFIVAAGTGVLIRSRRAHEEKSMRDRSTLIHM